jgi:hypothetical protein
MNGWTIFALIVLAIIVLLGAFNARDLYRYIKISSM